MARFTVVAQDKEGGDNYRIVVSGRNTEDAEEKAQQWYQEKLVNDSTIEKSDMDESPEHLGIIATFAGDHPNLNGDRNVEEHAIQENWTPTITNEEEESDE